MIAGHVAYSLFNVVFRLVETMSMLVCRTLIRVVDTGQLTLVPTIFGRTCHLGKRPVQDNAVMVTQALVVRCSTSVP